jgi:hypothetical protein
MVKNMKLFITRNSRKYIFLLLTVYFLASFVLYIIDQSLTSKLRSKIWAHRVNSIEKLNEVNEIFNGVEFDVVFLEAENRFDVNHPPTKSIGLSLLKYLTSIKNTSTNQFWVDFKNLTSENMNKSLLKLDSICQITKIKRKQFIIESTNPEHLELFQDLGYQTSFYLPTSLCNANRTLKENILHDIKLKISLYPTSYISMDKCNYELINRSFPEQKKLLWLLPYQEPYSINPLTNLRKIKNILYKYHFSHDNNIKVILFSYEAAQGNR